MGQTAVYPAEFEVAVDGRKSSAQAVLSENLLEEAAGIGRKAIFGHEIFPLVAVFVGGGAEPANGEFGGELVRQGINPATDLREGHGFGFPCLNWDFGDREIGGICPHPNLPTQVEGAISPAAGLPPQGGVDI